MTTTANALFYMKSSHSDPYVTARIYGRPGTIHENKGAPWGMTVSGKVHSSWGNTIRCTGYDSYAQGAVTNILRRKDDLGIKVLGIFPLEYFS